MDHSQDRSVHSRRWDRASRRLRTLCLCAAFISLLSPACGTATGLGLTEPIRIGFAGELTGLHADLAVDGRDGAVLAVDAINASGGVLSRPLELLIRDDLGNPEVARKVDAELVASGVVAIIGHFTSVQTAAVIDRMNASGVVLISPTAAGTDFSGRDDCFFRVIPDNDTIGRHMARHIYSNRGLRRLLGVYDLGNAAYTHTAWESVRAEFAALGGESKDLGFTAGSSDPKEIARQIASSDADSVLIVASAVDTALLAQYSRLAGLQAPLFASPWALTSELIEKGGRRVEGLELGAYYNPHSQSPAFRAFLKAFEARYRRPPGFSAAYSYEAVQALAAAIAFGGRAALQPLNARPDPGSAVAANLSAAPTPGLCPVFKNLPAFDGIQGRIRFDPFGDVRRDIHIAIVSSGRFEILRTIPPDQQ